jgi:hypothetical protein
MREAEQQLTDHALYCHEFLFPKSLGVSQAYEKDDSRARAKNSHERIPRRGASGKPCPASPA